MADLTPAGGGAPPWGFIEWALTGASSLAGLALGGVFGAGWRLLSQGEAIKRHERDIAALKTAREADIAVRAAAPTREQMREDMRDLGRMVLDGVDARFDGVDARFDGVDARFDTVDNRFGQLDERMGRLDTRVDNMAVKP